MKHLKKFEQVSDKIISDEKIKQLKSIGWSEKQISSLIDFLMSDDDVKIDSLEGIPSNLKVKGFETSKIKSFE